MDCFRFDECDVGELLLIGECRKWQFMLPYAPVFVSLLPYFRRPLRFMPP